MATTLTPAEWYMKLLSPLSPDIKLDLISKLSESLKEKNISKVCISFFRFLQYTFPVPGIRSYRQKKKSSSFEKMKTDEALLPFYLIKRDV